MLSTNNNETPLGKKLRELGMPESDRQADAFDKATEQLSKGEITAKRFLSIWAKSALMLENA